MPGGDVIELLDSSDDSDDELLTPCSSNFRILDDGCLEILDDDNGNDDTSAAAAKKKKKPACRSGRTALATVGKKKKHKSASSTTTVLLSRNKSSDIGNQSLAATAVKRRSSSSSNNDDDNDNDERKMSPKKKPKKEENHRIAGDDDISENEEEEDEVVQLVVPPLRAFIPAAASMAAAAAAAAADPQDEGEEEIQLVGHTGNNALADFPHSRENCVQFLFQINSKKHCINCYCFVCDAPATDCSSWQLHCNATYSDPYWKNERKKHKTKLEGQRKRLQNGKKNGKGGRASNGSISTSSRLAAIAPRAVIPSGRQENPNSLPVKTLLDAVTRIYHSERSPPASSPFVTSLRHYQKQSLSFMIDTEDSQEGWRYRMNRSNIARRTRGGWLCSEVGMGKTAVVIALVASKPMAIQNTMARTKNEVTSRWHIWKRKRVKATVIMTSVSLMGQWEDECKKHAPHLNVVRFHPSSWDQPNQNHIYDADIVITTATYQPDRWSVCGIDLDKILFHRVVMDESHLFKSRPASANYKKAMEIPAPNRWCVTATPMTYTPTSLEEQAMYLGMPWDIIERLSTDTEFLKTHMIRHVKAQRIDGAVALALPKLTSNVAIVKMTREEHGMYIRAVKKSRVRLNAMKRKNEAAGFYKVTNSIVYSLTNSLLQAESSKVKALEESIVNLIQRDPDMRAIVFTQMRQQLAYIKSMIERLGRKTRGGIRLYTFDGQMSHKKRDQYIRSFQSDQGPAVFIMTLKTGSVGITLTAASHVFLMEPSINPTDEVQAAGRISRLGQTKCVAMTKFVYKDTYETNVVKLHDKIDSGEIRGDTSNDGLPKAALRLLLDDISI